MGLCRAAVSKRGSWGGGVIIISYNSTVCAHRASVSSLTLGLADEGAELPASSCSAVGISLRIGGLCGERDDRSFLHLIRMINIHYVD